MIANRNKSKIPFKSMPGIKQREIIVKKFFKEFGEKFAVFGKGWDGFTCAKGYINFFDQEKVIRESWLTIGIDHFYNYDGYYSDRLPISLVSGVIHLTYKTPGLEKIFTDKEDLFFWNDPDEAILIAKQLLNIPKKDLIEMGMKVRNKYLEVLFEKNRFIKMFSLLESNFYYD